MPKVYIVDDGNEARNVENMFLHEQGWEICYDLYDADLVQFVGGEDVDPLLYQQRVHPTTYFNKERDGLEIDVYHEALNLGIPMAGICRGGQFLNVMNGGKLWQNVDGHNSGSHRAWLPGTATPIDVTSVHHQMMDPNYGADPHILMTACQSKRKSGMSSIHSTSYTHESYPPQTNPTDIETIYYPHTNCLCFQPHPEYAHKETRVVYLAFIDTFLFNIHKVVENAETA